MHTYAPALKIPPNYNKLNLPTWYGPAYNLSRQIDYFIISTPQRNWVKTIKNEKIPNNRQPMHRRIIQIPIQISIKTNLTFKITTQYHTTLKTLGEARKSRRAYSLLLKTLRRPHTVIIKGGPKYATYFIRPAQNMPAIFYGSIATPKPTEFYVKNLLRLWGARRLRGGNGESRPLRCAGRTPHCL